MWRYLVVRALEVSWSPWGGAHRASAVKCGAPQPIPLVEAVDDLLAALDPWPWRQARAAQLAASLCASLEGTLGRPAYVGDLMACATWLASLPDSDRALGASLLRALGVTQLGWTAEVSPSTRGATAL